MRQPSEFTQVVLLYRTAWFASQHAVVLLLLCRHTVMHIVDAARIVCGVRPSVCLSRRSTAATAAGGFAGERRAGRSYRSIRARCGSRAAGVGAQQQVRAVSRT